MKLKSLRLLFVLTTAFAFSAIAQQQANEITLKPKESKTKISKHIYGHFAEHLGRCIYDGFYIGEENKVIPNTNGVRNDIIAALKNLNIPNLRWPGGCFADTYHWKDGIGPKKDRPSIVNTWWGGVTENNSFGTHDFLNMCELLNTEPYLAGNLATGTVQELSDWVQYVNFNGDSPMSKLRRANGRDTAWKVKFWGVGNEAWGCGGNMKPDYYANEYRKYATFMTDWENTSKVFRIASGANGGDYNWTETLMKNIPRNLIEGIDLHHYANVAWSKKGSATQFSEQQYFATMKSALHMEELVTKHAAIMDKYDPEKKIALVVDEWGGWYEVEPGTNPGFLYQQNTIRDAMIAGVTLNVFNNHAERVRMANLAQTVNVLQAVILTEKEKMILTPTYHVLEMYKVHQDATLIPLSINTQEYVLGDQKLPALSASASIDKNGVTHITLVNIDAQKSHELNINIQDQVYKTINGRIVNSAKLNDYNSFQNPDLIKPAVFKDAKLKGNQIQLVLPAHSVVVLALK
jgi:alpha-N-arabinofuranosidase